MGRNRNGTKFVPLQATLVLGLLLLIPAIEYPAGATALEEIEGPTSVIGFQEEDLQEAILAEIIRDYRTFLSEDDKARLPGLIIAAANRHGYDPFFVAGVIETESSFNNQAVSRAGARGLMQLLPSTAEAMAAEVGVAWEGPGMLHDPATNLELGLTYLRKLEARFGNLDIALAAYNMGPSLLDQKMATGFRPRGIYSGKINATYREFSQRADEMRGRVVAEVQL
jgi:soluble lytic murein transglycosylase